MPHGETTPRPRLDRERLHRLRSLRYRWRPELAVRTEDDALRFVDEVGLCFLFAAEGIELPTLWGAINGSNRPLPHYHDDHALGLAWEWKDTLPSRRAVYYGKLVRGKPTFVSLSLFPCFYALSDNFGDPDDYLDSYRDGKLSEEARRVYEVLLERGALPTSILRREAGLYGQHAATRFDRALAELQRALRIAKAGISDANRWKYCYVYDLLPRLYPEQVEQGLALSSRDAMRRIIARYLQTVVASPREKIAHLFNWDRLETEMVVEMMLASRQVTEAEVAGEPAAWLVDILSSGTLAPGS